MSFRYTNQLIGVFQQRILLERARKQLLLTKFTGRCNGIVVEYSSSGETLSIRATPEGRKLYEDAKGVAQNLDDLSAAIKGAIFDASQQLTKAKEEMYRQSYNKNDAIRKNPNHTRWFAQDGPSLRPFVWEAIRDAPLKAALADAGRAPPSASLPRCNIVGSSLNVSGIAATNRLHRPALLFLDPSHFSCFNGRYTSPDHLVAGVQRYHLAAQERYFWQRVDLVRKAQINVIGSTRKRGYINNSRTPQEIAGTLSGTASPARDVVDKVELQFVHD